MAYTTINDPTQYFNTILYTGDGTTRNITGMNFKPDLLWVKRRSSTLHHRFWDTTRGAGYQIYSSLTNEEAYDITAMSAFLSDGFSIPSGSLNNTNSETYVAWHWKANAGTTSSNTDGSITSTVQANTTAGFSIVTYTGTGTSGSTVGHGLNKKPNMIIVKNRDSALDWHVWHSGLDSTGEGFLFLNKTDNAYNYSYAYLASNSSTFTPQGNTKVNASGANMLAYCFADVKGYSKFGKYTGNGSSDGTFVYTGFRPAFVIVKRTDSTGNWGIYDNKRLGYNVDNNPLYADVSDAEGTSDVRDLLSNGFKQRNTGGGDNASGGTFIYMAFAENPFVSSTGIPVTAR